MYLGKVMFHLCLEFSLIFAYSPDFETVVIDSFHSESSAHCVFCKLN